MDRHCRYLQKIKQFGFGRQLKRLFFAEFPKWDNGNGGTKQKHRENETIPGENLWNSCQ